MNTDVHLDRIKMTGISKTYGAIQSLRNVDLTLKAGEVLGLVGDNGAGKSTLTKILSGAVSPTSGTITLEGKPVVFESPADARAEHIEMVYQDLSLCDTVDVAGNLFMGREPLKSVCGLKLMDKAVMHHEASEMLKGLGVKIPNTRTQVQHLSGGQRQAIAIARAVGFNPKVLIMDEPTAALAVAEVEAVLELIKKVSELGVSVILITHRLQDLFLVCDRIMVMAEGQNVAEKKIDETDLADVVDLIVGQKFTAQSAQGMPSAKGSSSTRGEQLNSGGA
ncbi:ATP-binding cassette domain-containing protein [Vibrio nigripulchritudo]|uniref:ATP-binding cassette domain-containing protein n=1 Tax=Vibrio nigripulchritudo TaxID=28173 RepID=UPI0003B21A57|nr:ATP-binding cassette domain-containing protein [Vibrio nigripulchritudo]CCN73205.1 putative SUGAR ABC transporter [Vibrio nigripulchritudo SFn118]